MAKLHLLITAEPTEGKQDRVAVCGATVPNAEAVPIADLGSGQPVSILFCKKCFSRQYFYLIATGQEAKDIEAA